MLTSAPFTSSSSTTALWPLNEAQYSGVLRYCVHIQTIWTGNNTVEHDMDSKPCQEWRLQPQPLATDVQPQHDLGKRLTVEQCVLPASGGDTETSGAAVNELSQKWDYTFTSREPHILSPGVDIDRSGEESLNCLHISSLSSIMEICSSLGIETRIIRSVSYKENCVRDKPTSKSSALRLPLQTAVLFSWPSLWQSWAAVGLPLLMSLRQSLMTVRKPLEAGTVSMSDFRRSTSETGI